MNLANTLEAILFWKGEAVSRKKLAEITARTPEEITAALLELEKNLTGRGVQLLTHEGDVTLVTAREADQIIDALSREEISRDLGKAGLETLAIILYRGPVARRDIDYIRGVNSQYVLRNLLVRGLIQRDPDPKNGRNMLYMPTKELLIHMGVSKREDIPEYVGVRETLEKSAEDLSNREAKDQAAEVPLDEIENEPEE